MTVRRRQKGSELRSLYYRNLQRRLDRWVTRREANAPLQPPGAAGYEASQTLGGSGGDPREKGSSVIYCSLYLRYVCMVGGAPLKSLEDTEYRSVPKCVVERYCSYL